MAISEQVSRIQQAKTAIKTAIIQKGVEVPESAKIDTFSTYIQQIEAGGGEPNLQAKTVTPTASGTTVTPDSDYDGLSSVTVTGDNNLAPANIKKGTTIFGVEGTYGGGGGTTTNGFLPMPVTNLTFTQEKYTRGKGTVKFIFPKDTTSVDILVKENELPTNTGDYNQKITTENGEAEIIFDKHEDGTYASQYGIWAVSNNDSGTQTALSRSNRDIYDFLYATGDILESQVNGLNLSLSYQYWGNYINSSNVPKSFACKKLGDHLLFNQGKPYSTSDSIRYGLFDLNLKTNELKNIASNYCTGIIQVFNTTPVNNKYLIMPDVGARILLYDSLNGTVTNIGAGNLAFNAGILLDNNTVFCTSGYTSAPKKLFNFSDNTLKTLYVSNTTSEGVLANCQLVKTTQGVFAITKWSTSTSTSNNYNFCYKYNETTESFDIVKYGDGDGVVLAPKYKAQIYETSDGVIFMSYEGTEWNAHIYDGTKFINSGYSSSYSFYGMPIFSIGSHNCYLKNGKIYEFVGTKIQQFADLGDTTARTFVRVFEFSNGNYLLMTSSHNYLINGETNTATKTSENDTIYSNDKAHFLFVDDTVYYSSLTKSYAISNDGTVTTLYTGTSQGSELQKYTKVNGKIVAFSYNTYFYPLVLESGTFTKLSTTISSSSASNITKNAYGRGNYIYFVYSYTPTYKNNSSWEQWASGDDLDVYRYNIQDKTLDKLDGRKVSLHLGSGNYWSATDKKVYNFETGASENVSFETVNLFSNGLDASDNTNLWSSYSLAMSVTTTSISVLYTN